MDMSFGSNTSSSSKQDDEPIIDDESSTDEEVVQHLNSSLKAVGESPLKRPSKITPTFASRKISKI